MKSHGSQPTNDSSMKGLSSESFTIKHDLLRLNAANFTVHLPQFANDEDSPHFIHPFSCKIIGPRGSGKTSFTVSYIQKTACLMFPKIFIGTASQEQPLYQLLKDNDQIYCITLEELEAAIESHKDILIILDDIMQNLRYNNTLETVFTRGRHLRISVMSLEQDLFYSNHIERRNADYFVLMRMRDTSSLMSFYKKFCNDVQHWRFIDVYEFAVEKPLGYLILDFVSYKYKYRVNSLNLYFDVKTSRIECIDKSFNSALREQVSMQLQNRFQLSIADLKCGKKYCENERLSKYNCDLEVPTQKDLVQEEHTEVKPIKDKVDCARNKSVRDEPSYVCDICHDDYCQPKALAIHMALYHGTYTDGSATQSPSQPKVENDSESSENSSDDDYEQGSYY